MPPAEHVWGQLYVFLSSYYADGHLASNPDSHPAFCRLQYSAFCTASDEKLDESLGSRLINEHPTHPHEVVEAGADFEGPDPLLRTDQRRLLVSHIHQRLLDVPVGGDRLRRVALEDEPRPQRLEGAVGTTPALQGRWVGGSG